MGRCAPQRRHPAPGSRARSVAGGGLFGVVGVHPAERVASPVVRLLGDLQLTADVSDILALVQHPISGRQLDTLHLQLAYQPTAQAVDVELTLFVDEPPSRRGEVADVWSVP